MKKNLDYRPHVLTVTRNADKNEIKKFLNWERHPRQKSTPYVEYVNPHLPIHLMF